MTDANVVTVTQTVPVGARLTQGLSAFRSFLRQPAVVRSMPMIVVAAVIAVGLLAITVLREPAYVVLFPQLEENDKAAILQTLTDKGVKAKLDGTTGQMTVPRADFYRAKMLLASAGLPKASTSGYDLLGQMPLGTSRSVEAAKLRQAQETELALLNQPWQPHTLNRQLRSWFPNVMQGVPTDVLVLHHARGPLFLLRDPLIKATEIRIVWISPSSVIALDLGKINALAAGLCAEVYRMRQWHVYGEEPQSFGAFFDAKLFQAPWNCQTLWQPTSERLLSGCVFQNCTYGPVALAYPIGVLLVTLILHGNAAVENPTFVNNTYHLLGNVAGAMWTHGKSAGEAGPALVQVLTQAARLEALYDNTMAWNVRCMTLQRHDFTGIAAVLSPPPSPPRPRWLHPREHSERRHHTADSRQWRGGREGEGDGSGWFDSCIKKGNVPPPPPP